MLDRAAASEAWIAAPPPGDQPVGPAVSTRMRGYAPDRFGRILLATDFSASSEPATHRAIALAAALEATLIAVTVIDPRSLQVRGRPARVDQVRSERETQVAGLRIEARRAAVTFEYLIWVGEPSESILESAHSENVSLIVVGSHGRSGVGRFLIGSVSDEVIRHSPVPVLVVGPSGSSPERE